MPRLSMKAALTRAACHQEKRKAFRESLSQNRLGRSAVAAGAELADAGGSAAGCRGVKLCQQLRHSEGACGQSLWRRDSCGQGTGERGASGGSGRNRPA